MVPFACTGGSTSASASTAGWPRCSASRTPPCSRCRREATDPRRPDSHRRAARRRACRYSDRGRHDRGGAAAGRERQRRCAPGRRDRPAADPRPRQRPHPRHGASRQGHGRSLVARASAQCLSLDRGRAHARVQISLRLHRRGGDGAQGLHRLLRPRGRDSGAVARRHRRGRARVQRRRHARGDRADDGGCQLLPRDPRPARRACRRRCASGRRRSASIPAT